MKKETVDQLIQFLTLIAHYSREYALKLKAFEQVAKKHPEIFGPMRNTWKNFVLVP